MGAIQNSVNYALDTGANATKAITAKMEHDAQMKAGILQAVPEAAEENLNATHNLRAVNEKYDANIKNAITDEIKLQTKLAGMEVESENPDINPADKEKRVSRLLKGKKAKNFITLRAKEAADLANEHLQDEYIKRATILTKSALRLKDLTNLAERTNRTSMSPISDENIHDWRSAVDLSHKEIERAAANILGAEIGGKKN